MKLRRTRLGILAAAIAALAIPPLAAAESLVPPDNSAVNQYTESFPTAGGDKDSEKAKETGVTPAQTLGAKNAKRLEQHGEDGRVVAEVAAETAPVPVAPAAADPAPSPETASDKEKGGKDSDQPRQQREPEPEGAGSGTPGSGGDSGGAAAASGSSGASEVLSQATGFSSGQMGLLLPLVILGSLAWALAFLWRRRHQPTV